ncbi:FAD-binding and (Fe-S)-binding domain-containing protein [Microbacterium sp. X-17]|uniref:FAD-binding and (Fe-S)-binding domain-containing protein n=1 Tax=Microbacterium sp. X-17 TaxID=3144404 RepID=UPI0031F58305
MTSTITSGGVDVRTLASALADRVDGEVRFHDGSRAAYSTDASNYRQVPIGVVIPRTVEAAVEAVAVCREFAAPVFSRGGGTSLAGECTNHGVVIDWSKYCNRVLSLDPDARVAVVEPGIVLDDLNAILAPHGLQFGPKPATHSHCTLGGMIGNNSCGSSAQAYGKTDDNVRRLEVLTYEGDRFWAGPTSTEEFERIQRAGGRVAELYTAMRDLAEEDGDLIRERYPRIPRRVSGYNLDSLLPEAGFDVGRALVGSESTLVTVLRAELDLVPLPSARTFLVLGFPSIEDAADAAPTIAVHDPLTIEGIDSVLVNDQKTKRQNVEALHLLPEGDGWLVCEFDGDSQEESDAKAQRAVAALRERDVVPDDRVFDDPAHQKEILEVREAGLGATAWIPDRPDTWEGWEDAAVPPERLGDYLRDFGRLLHEFGYENVSRYGHFGQGCLHCRIPFDLVTEEGIAHYRAFIGRGAELVAQYGGSLSGEHGDGQARGALLPIMFGEEVIRLFERFKALFDPHDRMNPGKVVRPNPPTEDLRLGTGYRPKVDVELHFSYPKDRGQFDRAALRCVGVGNCRSHSGNVMCPSFRATNEEEHSTRGRSRLLFEMLEGQYRESPIADGWRSTEVRDALDLCLSCKGCKTDCPVNVDMATYKAEFLSHHYAGRLRPAAHYTMGWLPVWARLASVAPALVNRLARLPGVARVAKRLGGVEPDRPVPRFAPQRFTDWFAARPPAPPAPLGDAMIWPDTFTDNFHPSIGRAAVTVLEDAGYRVVLPPGHLCCGLTWISTGQLATAGRMLAHTAAALAAALGDDVPLVGLEPSCLAVFRSDAPELLPDDPNVAVVAERATSFAELLQRTPEWSPPHVGGSAVVQPHCHQHAVGGFAPDQAILDAAGIETTTVEGCCGLAGNFGFEAGHLDVSAAAAEHALLPALREASADARVIADGFSCRTQVEQLADMLGPGQRPLHLAEVLALQLGERRGVPVRVDRPGRAAERIPAAAVERALSSERVRQRS